MIYKINELNFNEIENYIPCGNVSRPRMRVVLYNSIVLNKNIFFRSWLW